MFSDKFAYDLNNPIQITKVSRYGEEYSEIYKVRTQHQKKVYFIQVDVFKNDVYFIKFYQKKDANHPDKYKKRYGNIKEFTRIVATCLKLSKKIVRKNPEAIFSFHGQWDQNDVYNERTISQRFSIYLRVLSSKINTDNYTFYLIQDLNILAIIPIHRYTSKNITKILSHFNALYEERLNELVIPSKEEYNLMIQEQNKRKS
jgi:hypothetical protein